MSMATPRLPFLWPFLFKAARPYPSQTLAQAPRRSLQSSTGRRQEISTQRYGTANEPPPQLRQSTPAQHSPSNPLKSNLKSNSKSKKEKEKASRQAKGEVADQNATTNSTVPQAPSQSKSPESNLVATAPSILSMPPPSSAADAKPAIQQQQQQQQQQQEQVSTAQGREPPKSNPDATTMASPSSPPKLLSTNPLEAVLNIHNNAQDATQSTAAQSYYHENASANPDPDEHRPPHINTPRYVHHFDTYSLVKRLDEGGWTDTQAVTVMKAVRLILLDNMELAREGLVSKSNVENETYLFRAACSELRTEVGMRRKSETEKTRSERTGLQHEVDILGQRVGMEASGLREELKGMVEGRKMAAREEGRSVDSKIQELNYRITVALNSDLRSDIEGVRWIITKRAITALAICVLMVIASLKYASSAWQHEDEMKKRAAAASGGAGAKSATTANGNGSGSSNGNGGGGSENQQGSSPLSAEAEFQRAGLVVQHGDNPGYISLG